MGKDNSLGRYRFDKRFRLPKFGSVKNPFETSKQTESIPAPKAEPTPVPVSAPVEKSPAEVRVASLQKTQRLPEAAPVEVKHRGEWLRKKPARFFFRLKQWATKLNPLSWFPRRKASAKSVLPAVERPVLQPELSLEKVRVVRNDLNDTDLEVVAAKAPTNTNDTPAARLRQKAMMRVSSRLAQAEQT